MYSAYASSRTVWSLLLLVILTATALVHCGILTSVQFEIAHGLDTLAVRQQHSKPNLANRVGADACISASCSEAEDTSLRVLASQNPGPKEKKAIGYTFTRKGATRQLAAVPQTLQTTLLVVSLEANENSNNYFSVQAAVDAVPMENTVRRVIYIKPGTYYGAVFIPRGKDYITFVGERNRRTVLTYRRKARDVPGGLIDSPSVIIEASYFIAQDITFENTSPRPALDDFTAQAPAIRVSGDKMAFYRCTFLSWQDTLYADKGRHYYKDCRVEGSVDFILGSARAVFDGCTIYSRGNGYITAQSRMCNTGCPSASSGFVFLRCNLTGLGETFLGRPWKEYARVLYIDNFMGSLIAPKGWEEWLTTDGPLFGVLNTYFAECNNSGPGANRAARISWTFLISNRVANRYRNFRAYLDGEDWLGPVPSYQALNNSVVSPEFLIDDVLYPHATNQRADKIVPKIWANLP